MKDSILKFNSIKMKKLIIASLTLVSSIAFSQVIIGGTTGTAPAAGGSPETKGTGGPAGHGLQGEAAGR